MWWRHGNKEHEANKGDGNKRKLKALVACKGIAPGLLAYAPDETGELSCVGWVAVAPRNEYPRMATSKILKPVDDEPVWCVSCLFIAKTWRRRGVSTALIDAAAQYAFERGAAIVEGYPFEPQKDTAAAFIWTGTTVAYEKAGFVEITRHSPTRPIMRRHAL